MNGNEKSDSAIVAMKPVNEPRRRGKERAERSAGAEGNAEGPHGGPGTGPGCLAPGDRPRTGSCTQGQREAVHRSAAPHRRRPARPSLSLAEAGSGGGRGRDDVGCLRRRPGGAAARPRKPHPQGLLPGAAKPACRHPQIRRPATATRHRRTGGQDRPARDGGGSQCHLRDGLPRLRLRVSARQGAARCVGRARSRHLEPAGELDTGRRHQGFLRQHQP
jgi:hypothetical protein